MTVSAARLFTWRAFAVVVAAGVVGGVAAWLVLPRVMPERPVPVKIRWKADVGTAERAQLEQRFHLSTDYQSDVATWAYWLSDTSTPNIRAIVQDPRVDDTDHVNRVKFRPAFAYDRSRRLIFFSAVWAAVAGVVALGVVAAGKL
jgi:hypothetical protein